MVRIRSKGRVGVVVKPIKLWWDGEFVLHENDNNSGLVFIGGYYKRHWTSRVAHALFEFLQKEWKWVIGISIPITGLIMTYVRFF